MTIELTILLSVISVSCAVFFGFKSYSRTNDKELSNRVAQETKVDMKLDEIGRNVSDIKYDISATKKEVQQLRENIVTLEASCKSAHHRIDGIESKAHNKEE